MTTIKVGDVFTYEGELYIVTKDYRPEGGSCVLAAAAHNFYGSGFYGHECSFAVTRKSGLASLKRVKI
jgi:hypothetical protein